MINPVLKSIHHISTNNLKKNLKMFEMVQKNYIKNKPRISKSKQKQSTERFLIDVFSFIESIIIIVKIYLKMLLNCSIPFNMN